MRHNRNKSKENIMSSNNSSNNNTRRCLHLIPICVVRLIVSSSAITFPNAFVGDNSISNRSDNSSFWDLTNLHLSIPANIDLLKIKDFSHGREELLSSSSWSPLLLSSDLLLLALGGIVLRSPSALRHWQWVSCAANLRILPAALTSSNLTSTTLACFAAEVCLLASLALACAASSALARDMEEDGRRRQELENSRKTRCPVCIRARAAVSRRSTEFAPSAPPLPMDLEMVEFKPSAPPQHLLFP